MTTDAEINAKLARVTARMAVDREAIEERLAQEPELLALVQACRKTFGPLRLSGPAVSKPDPDWTRWPAVKLSEMAEQRPAKGENHERSKNRSRR